MLNSIQTPLPQVSHSPKMTLSLFLFPDKHSLPLSLFFSRCCRCPVFEVFGHAAAASKLSCKHTHMCTYKTRPCLFQCALAHTYVNQEGVRVNAHTHQGKGLLKHTHTHLRHKKTHRQTKQGEGKTHTNRWPRHALTHIHTHTHTFSLCRTLFFAFLSLPFQRHLKQNFQAHAGSLPQLKLMSVHQKRIQ